MFGKKPKDKAQKPLPQAHEVKHKNAGGVFGPRPKPREMPRKTK